MYLPFPRCSYVLQVITGLMMRKDNAADKFSVAIIPVGTANAMAHEIDNNLSKDFRELVQGHKEE